MNLLDYEDKDGDLTPSEFRSIVRWLQRHLTPCDEITLGCDSGEYSLEKEKQKYFDGPNDLLLLNFVSAKQLTLLIEMDLGLGSIDYGFQDDFDHLEKAMWVAFGYNITRGKKVHRNDLGEICECYYPLKWIDSSLDNRWDKLRQWSLKKYNE